MIDPNSIETALTEAEDTCHEKLCQILGLTKGVDCFVSINGGRVECAVFDIGYPQAGEVMGFEACVYHFRGQLDLYSRNRRTLQKWLMALIANMPISPTQGASNELDGISTVQTLRIAPESNSIAEISTTELKDAAKEKAITAFTTTVKLDIVFTIGPRK